MIQYFHELSNNNKREALIASPISFIMLRYTQPKWCNKHEALNGLFGCEILLGLSNEKVTKTLCSNCENFKNK